MCFRKKIMLLLRGSSFPVIIVSYLLTGGDGDGFPYCEDEKAQAPEELQRYGG